MNLQKQDILRWLRAEDPRELEGLWRATDDILLFRDLDLGMIGVGPFILNSQVFDLL